MKWKCLTSGVLTAMLAGAVAAGAQEIPPPRPFVPQPALPQPGLPMTQPAEEIPQPGPDLPQPAEEIPQPVTGAPVPPPLNAGSGLEAESLPGELVEDISGAVAAPRLGPTPITNVRILMDYLGVANLVGDSGIRTYAWLEGGYTGASTGSGLLSVEPRQNRFGNEFLLNQIGWAVQKPLQQDEFDIGFMMRYFAGADAALGAAKGGIGNPPGNPQFGQDFRDLYLSAHLPILTDGGVDVKVGRTLNTIIGYNGFRKRPRSVRSIPASYQFFYSQDGAFTGFLTDWHDQLKQLDIWNGMTLAANTFFKMRANLTHIATSARLITG